MDRLPTLLVLLITASGLSASPRPASAAVPGGGPRQLNSRLPHDQLLRNRDRRLYEAALQAALAPAGQSPGEGVSRLLQVSVHVRYKQEVQAIAAAREGLVALLADWCKRTRKVRSDLRLLEGVFGEISSLVERDPEGALAFLRGVDREAKSAPCVARQDRLGRECAAPLARLWFNLSRPFYFQEEDRERAAFWVAEAEDLTLQDRPLTEDQLLHYELDKVALAKRIEADRQDWIAAQQRRSTDAVSRRVRPGEPPEGTVWKTEPLLWAQLEGRYGHAHKSFELLLKAVHQQTPGARSALEQAMTSDPLFGLMALHAGNNGSFGDWCRMSKLLPLPMKSTASAMASKPKDSTVNAEEAMEPCFLPLRQQYVMMQLAEEADQISLNRINGVATAPAR